MFGKNAFSSTSAIDAAVAEPTTISSKPLKDKRSKYSKVYDGPTTSLPPMSTLFDDFLNDFMDVKPATATSLVPESSVVRFAGDGKETSSVVDSASVISEDVAPLVDMHIKRVGMQDVQELGDWFKSVVLTSSDDACKYSCLFASLDISSSSLSVAPKPTATPKVKSNGTTSTHATPSTTPLGSSAKKGKGTPASMKKGMSVDSPVSVGKKRKVVPA